MNEAGVLFRPTEDFIYAISRTELDILIQTASGDVSEIFLEYGRRDEKDFHNMNVVKMRKEYSDGIHDQFRCRICLTPIAAYLRYRFCIKGADGSVNWYGSEGFRSSGSATVREFFEFQWPNPDDYRSIDPEKQKMIYYQIFPDRFFRGKESYAEHSLEPWGSIPNRLNYMGGTLEGIAAKLPYLSDLGINCIYLNPIFAARSNHKYDTQDYYKIDPGFGSEDDFRKLVDQAHERKIKVILDGVFNHSGIDWHPFQDVIKKGEDSTYFDWFFINKYPIDIDASNYDCVGFYPWMPKINLANRQAQDYFISVGKYWIEEFGIDGWRLDVADEVPTRFWERFAFEMRSVKPEVILLGETWIDAFRLISGNRLNSAMNYLFRDAVIAWLAENRIDAKEFDKRLNHLSMLYPFEILTQMYNLIDSHDTARFLFTAKGDVRKLKMAVAVQMTFVGCPALYYGDELGMSGDNDPLCRGCMVWDLEEQNQDLLDWYKRLISFRRQHDILAKGRFQSAFASENVIGFYRFYQDECSLVMINGGETSSKIPMELGEWKEQLYMTAEEEGEQDHLDREVLRAYSLRVFTKI